MRIVSLVPSSTETLLQIGADVVACTRFCEQPSIRHVGGTKNPDIAAIIDLAPDVVVLDREENRREDADALRTAGLDLYISDVTSLDDARRVVIDLVRIAGAGAGAGDADGAGDGDALAGALDVGDHEPLGLSVLVPIWRRPWMALGADTYGDSVLRHLGCRQVIADVPDAPSGRYPEFSLAALESWSPDVIAVPSEPYDFTDTHLSELAQAAPTARVVRVDGQDLFWWGSRTPAAVDRLHRQLAALLV